MGERDQAGGEEWPGWAEDVGLGRAGSRGGRERSKWGEGAAGGAQKRPKERRRWMGTETLRVEGMFKHGWSVIEMFWLDTVQAKISKC